MFGALKRLIRKVSPGLVFLSETKLYSSKADRIKEVLGFVGGFGVASNGRSGGLLLLWSDEVDVVVTSYSPEQAQKSTSTEVLTTEKKKAPTPRVLRERENNLVKTIITDQEFVQVDLFDNGTIDNDTISVYHNNELVVKSAKLNTTPISLKIRNTATDRLHELVIVAENLGEIPPNTALMVVTAGRKRYEIFLSSTEEKNAKVIIEYQRN